jgi:hypothetical protein
MTSNNIKQINKSIIEHHDNQIQRNHPSAEVIVKAIQYPPGYLENKPCNKKEEKHKNCHPIHCYHMQPMQSATTASVIDPTHNHAEQNSQYALKK